jgi:hypothetical protein
MPITIDNTITPIYRADGTYILIEPSSFSRFHPRSMFGTSDLRTHYTGCRNPSCPYYMYKKN